MVVETSRHPVALEMTTGLSLAPISTCRSTMPAPQPAQRRCPPVRWSGRLMYSLGESLVAILFPLHVEVDTGMGQIAAIGGVGEHAVDILDVPRVEVAASEPVDAVHGLGVHALLVEGGEHLEVERTALRAERIGSVEHRDRLYTGERAGHLLGREGAEGADLDESR